ncbi:Lysine-specific demethylase 4A [Dissostichus eleginoides]|uniref:Lysine-specific demethylase 4A n=1 Tax=Dissostichus eleginoides TaxID=100907 RepID=A0AAD9EY08_DISEL|nr:Lysine-specific demethylase 4A [Dissostichus eleginoides]
MSITSETLFNDFKNKEEIKTALKKMKVIKSKYRSRLTDRHLTDCLRLAVCSYEPDYKALTGSVQPSH